MQRKEKELSECPTLERVQEIMDMYREATEKFAAVSDQRHQVSQQHTPMLTPRLQAAKLGAPCWSCPPCRKW